MNQSRFIAMISYLIARLWVKSRTQQWLDVKWDIFAPVKLFKSLPSLAMVAVSSKAVVLLSLIQCA